MKYLKLENKITFWNSILELVDCILDIIDLYDFVHV